ncbi:MAG: hypothetical protein JWM28_807, partial [Chitinophagaceae bacterium]|nr:hypothetical protein [Chitinophagaceae bacterium]
MQKFELILKNEKRKFYDRLTVFILLFNTAAISWSLLAFHQTLAEKITGISALLLLLFALTIYQPANPTKRKDVLFIVTAALIFVYWFFAGYGWLAIIIA